MATFREIDERLLALVDEDGEILDLHEFEQLNMEREKKIENMCRWVQDLRDTQKNLRDEIERLQGLKRAAERKEERLSEFVTAILNGEKFKTPLVSVSYRVSVAVDIENEDDVRRFAERHDQYEDILRYKTPEISKPEVKRLLQSGVVIPGATIVNRTNTVIK